jgi:DNA-nicking Smr family endonuclease
MGRGRDKDGGKDRPGLGLEDFRLWKEFTRDIDPLEEPDWDAMEMMTKPAAPQQNKTGEKISVPEKVSLKRNSGAKQAEPPQLDLRTELRLRRGQMPIDARLDLHGFNQEQAHGMLNDFLTSAHARGKRCVLVITGKGRGGLSAKDAYAPDLQPGILKQKLPHWLSMHPLRDIVLKAFPAAPRDGGSGAFYIYLRRHRGTDY